MNDSVEFDYDYLMQKALRFLMRDVLGMVAELKDSPGEHHFYIEFLTAAPDVEIPDHLRKDYQERMTIVLQHQFENLIVTDDYFAVTLWFKNKEANLKIPFDAVTSFADPSAQFGLRFEPAEVDEKNDTPADKPAAMGDADTDESKKNDTAADQKNDGADVVSLDAFRKK